MSGRPPRALPRGGRNRLAALVAVVVLALAVLAVIAAIQIHAGRDHTALGSVRWITERMRTRDWTDAAVLVTGIVLAVLGLLLVVAGLFPARRPMLRLSDPDDHTIAGITRLGLHRDLTATAARVDGVSSAKATLRRGVVRVRATSALRDHGDLHDSVEAAVRARLEALQPVRPLRVQVHVRPGGN